MLNRFADPDFLVALFLVLAAMLNLPWLVVWTVRHPSFGITSVAALIGIEAFGTLPQIETIVSLGPPDLAIGVLAAATALRIRHPSPRQLALLAVLALVVLSVLRSFASFGIGGSDMAFRAELYFVLAALYASTFDRADVRTLVLRVRQLAAFLTGVAICRWGLVLLGMSGDAAWVRDDFGVARVLTANETLVVMFALASYAGSWWGGERKRVGFAPLTMMLVVLLAQHRSVWIAGLVTIAVVFVLSREGGGRRAVAVAGAVACLVLGAILLPRIAEPVFESLSTASSSSGTWEWRVERWGDIWAEHSGRGGVALVIGSEYGHPWLVVPPWEPAEVSPHNFYIQVAVRLGLAAALLLFGVYLWSIRRLARRDADPIARVLGAMLVGQLVYFIPYAGSPLLGLILGGSVAWAAARSQPDAAGSTDASVGYLKGAL